MLILAIIALDPYGSGARRSALRTKLRILYVELRKSRIFGSGLKWHWWIM